jgi:FkbM family methyltransferase
VTGVLDEAAGPDDRASRGSFFVSAADYAPLIGVRARDAVYVVSTDDRSVGRSLFVTRARGEMDLLVTALRVLERLGEGQVRTRTLLDVGANIGTTSIFALTSQGFPAAIAIEPQPDTFRLLRMNVVANDLEERVRTFQCAVSDADGTARMSNPAKSGNAKILPPDLRKRVREIAVPSRKLDSMVESGDIASDEIGLVWLDVQGHEGHVLAGASRLTERGIPVVLEFSPRLLTRSEGLEPLVGALSRDYTDIVDLRAGKAANAVPFPVERIDELIARHERDHTDLLAIRRAA